MNFERVNLFISSRVYISTADDKTMQITYGFMNPKPRIEPRGFPENP